VKERDPFLCAAGSFFFPGLGQVYCGRILRGLAFLIPAIVLQVPYPFIYLSTYFQSTYYSTALTYLSSLLPLVSKLVDLIVRAIATYDAYGIAKSFKAESQVNS
jgi:TM2 domain-containing membrane protein YozV